MNKFKKVNKLRKSFNIIYFPKSIWDKPDFTLNKESKSDTGFVFYFSDTHNKVTLKDINIKVGYVIEDSLCWYYRKFSG